MYGEFILTVVGPCTVCMSVCQIYVTVVIAAVDFVVAAAVAESWHQGERAITKETTLGPSFIQQTYVPRKYVHPQL